MGKKDADYISLELEVPTPPDQQDVSPLDMVSGAVEEMVNTIRDDLGLEDKPDDQGS